jgi:hypothetical protein
VVSGKPTEEGWFWEWRTFGPRPERAAHFLEGFAVRGAAGLVCADDYFVGDLTDQNVKLRGDQLKLKPLLARLPDGLELYEETERLLFALPVGAEELVMAANLLGVEVVAGGSVGRDLLVSSLRDAPGVRFVAVRKRRTQYVVGDGWAELAEIELPRASLWSLGIQSRSIAETRRIRDLLDADGELEPVSYVEACRRWGGA